MASNDPLCPTDAALCCGIGSGCGAGVAIVEGGDAAADGAARASSALVSGARHTLMAAGVRSMQAAGDSSSTRDARSSSDDGTTRAWDVATGTQKAEFEGDKFSFTKSSGGDEQTVGAYVVTKKDNLVLVHQTHALTHNEPTAENNHAVAFFRAPGVVQTLECAGDRIAVGCRNGEVLHLQAPWLVDS